MTLEMARQWISVIKRAWSHLDVDQQLLISMARNALPPTAALWIIQSSTLGKSFDVVGYLPMILCILQQPILPRIQFLKTMLMTCILSCLAACIAILAGFCSTRARSHTTPPGQNLSDYNSSAAAVSGIWMIFSVWAIQTFRVFRPQYTTSCVIATMMAIVSIGSGANLYTTSETTKFVTQMIKMFFLANAFCTAVNLFIFPTTSRDVVFSDIKQYLDLIRNVASSEATHIRHLVQSQGSSLDRQHSTYHALDHGTNENEKKKDVHSADESPESLILLMKKMSKLHTKLQGDLYFAQHDFGWSNLDGVDLAKIVEHFRKLILSFRGMCALMPVFENVCERRAQLLFKKSPVSPLKSRQTDKEGESKAEPNPIEWRSIFLDLREPTTDIDNLIQQGCLHIEYALELDTKPTLFSIACFGWHLKSSRKRDLESEADHLPGSQGSTEQIEKLVAHIHSRKGSTIESWLVRSGCMIEKGKPSELSLNATSQYQYLSSNQEQLFVILFMQHSFQHISDVILDLVKFVDNKTNVRSQKRLILPSNQHLASFVQQFIGQQEMHEDFDNGLSHPATRENEFKDNRFDTYSDTTTRRTSRSFAALTTMLGSLIVKSSYTIGSHQSFFGFRVACAVMSVIIVGLLGETQEWFYNHRALWAAVFIPFSMSPNSGETLSLLGFRMIGSAWALILSIVNWYIVDGHPAGVIVFYFIFQFLEQYLVIKLPQYGSIWRPAMITRAIITGYILQTQVSQKPSPPATTLGQYPIYLLGPYRYVCTAIGVFVAFLWTVFPQAVSARSLVRKNLGNALSLLSLYYNCMHSTIGLWAVGSQGDLNDPNSPGSKLRHIRDNFFTQELATLEAIRGHIHFSRFEPSMGATFRRELFEEITNDVDTIIAYMNMIVYAAASLTRMGDGKQQSHWEQRLSRAFQTADFSSHSIAVVLSMLSVAVSNNQPLPPGLSPPQSYHLTRQIQMTDPDMFDLSHVEDPGYAAYAVIEIGTSMMYENLTKLVDHVKELVGVVEFVTFDKESNGKQI